MFVSHLFSGSDRVPPTAAGRAQLALAGWLAENPGSVISKLAITSVYDARADVVWAFILLLADH